MRHRLVDPECARARFRAKTAIDANHGINNHGVFEDHQRDFIGGKRVRSRLNGVGQNKNFFTVQAIFFQPQREMIVAS